MNAQARITKSVSYTPDELARVEAYLETIGRAFSEYAREAIREKMKREGQ